ncbi:MAG: hypothetical protein WAW73_20195 [Rhodoferax sp.]
MKYFDAEEAAKLNAKPWQVALLDANPSYLGWGPHEDYMCGDKGGWDSRQIVATWEEFGPWNLDDLNECVNFYFEVNRASEDCKHCDGNGYHQDAQIIVNTFYRHQCAPGQTPWNDKITEDEADALIAAGRAKAGETAATINAAQHGGGFLSHDAINRGILIQARAKRLLGVDGYCPHCNGEGYVHTAPDATVALILWWLHPRKGCSRGIEISSIQQSELPAVRDFLAEAAKRNAERFSGVSKIVEVAS